MGFGDLKKDSGVSVLNEFLADKSYIEGYQASQADGAIFELLSGAPSASFANALRWYKQINSYGNERSSFPGVRKPVDSYGPEGGAAGGDDEDDFDLFDDDDEEEEESEEAKKLREERVAAYAAKKSKKTALVAKSMVVLDIKPWDDETDMAAMEKLVRGIIIDGLLWGASKLVPVGYGIKKLQISTVVEDDKVSIDDLQEKICEDFEDFVQSVDVAAFNKL